VANYGDDNVTPLRWDESVWVPGINVSVGTVPYGIAITSDGLYAIVTNRDSNNITPLTRNGNEWISGIVVSVGTSPVDVAITPDRLHAIVVNANSDNITPLTWNGSIWIAGTVVSVGTDPTRVAIVSDGYGVRAIVTNWSSNNITPLTWDGSVWVAGSAVSVGTNPTGVAITPDGYRAIVTNSNTGDVTPLIWDGSVWVAGSVISVGITPANVAITSDGLRAIVANRGSNTIMPLTWNGSVWVAGTVVSVGTSPADVAITPDGLNALVANFGSDNITPLTWDGSVWVAETVISCGMYPYSVAITQSNYGTVGLRGAGYYSTSTGIGLFVLGSQTFTLNETGLAYRIGDRIRVILNNQADQYVDGLVTSYIGMNLTMNVDTVSDPGDYAIGNGNWTLGLVGAQGNQAFAGIGDANTVYWSNGVANSWSGEPTVTGVNAFQYVAIGTTGFNPSLVFTNTSVTPIIFQNFKSVSGDAEPLLIQAQCNSNANGNGGDLKLMGGFGAQSHGDVILQTPLSDTIGAGANNITFSKAAYGSTVQSSYTKLVAVNNSGYGSCALAPMAYGQTSPYPRCDKYYGTFGLVGSSQTYSIVFTKTIHGYSPLNNSSLTGKMLLGWTGNNGEFVSGGAALEFLVSIFIGTIGNITQAWTSLDGVVPSIDPVVANGWLSLNKNTVPGGVSGVVPDMPEITLTYDSDTFTLTIRAPSNDAGTLALFYWQFEYGGMFS
jgi:DNA-binding beta-propeller fold protein YncE